MMKTIFLTLIFFSISNALVDLGKIGPVYEIKERDLKEEIIEKIANINIKDVRKILSKSVDKAANIQSKLAGCVQDNKWSINNVSYISRDYYSIDGKLLFKKGDSYVQNYPVAASACVVNGASIEFSKKSLRKLLKIGKCDKIMVANADFRILQREMPNSGKFYPFNQELSDIMKVKCLPTRSEMYKSKISVEELYVEKEK